MNVLAFSTDLHLYHDHYEPLLASRAGPLTGNTEVNFLLLAPFFNFDPLNLKQRERIRAKNKSLRVRFVARQKPNMRGSGMPAQVTMTAKVSTPTAMSFTTEPCEDKGVMQVVISTAPSLSSPTPCLPRIHIHALNFPGEW